jgi:hypothetical protein
VSSISAPRPAGSLSTDPPSTTAFQAAQDRGVSLVVLHPVAPVLPRARIDRSLPAHRKYRDHAAGKRPAFRSGRWRCLNN